MNKFARQLLDWFQAHGRHDLPWQHELSPYRVWISEIMLQQTQVITVIPYFKRFMLRFPDIETLAQSTIDEVLHQWTGLGYYARARNMHKTAQIISNDFQNQFPNDLGSLMKLPGIGRTTAGAILTLAYQQRHPILDGNVKRVLTRYHSLKGWPGQAYVERKLWALADQHTPFENVAEYTQAIMDLGATVCVRNKPQCEICPVSIDCLAKQQNKQQAFPTPKPKKLLPTRETIFIVMQNDQSEFLLEKRPPNSIWGGLWTFPECEINTDIKYWIKDNWGYSVRNIFLKPKIRHTFSHFHLDITPAVIHAGKTINQVRDNGSYRWYQAKNVDEIGMPTPVKKLVEELNESNSTLRKVG
jgi:A/G-specific adenine glycosylase